MMKDDSWSDDDIIPLNSETYDNNDLIDLPTVDDFHYVSKEMNDLFELDKAALFVSQKKHIEVLNAIISKLIGPNFVNLIDKRIGELGAFGLETQAISAMILDEIPSQSQQNITNEHKIKVLVFRHLLKKHGLGALAERKEHEIEDLLKKGYSLEAMITIITE